LRQVSKQATNQSILYKPQTAIRVRWNTWPDTPLPQEEPAGENPPDGAIIDYYLATDAKKVELKIGKVNSSSDGKRASFAVFRHYSSDDTLYKVGNVNIPQYWIRPQQIISAGKGSHRFLFDLHYQPLNIPPSYPISAIYKNTAPSETSPWLMPGEYDIELIVDDRTYRQKLVIKMDPRVKTSTIDLQKQRDLSLIAYEGRKKCMDILNEIRTQRASLKQQMAGKDSASTKSFRDLDFILGKLESNQSNEEPGFAQLNGQFASLMNILQEADVVPTTQAINAVNEAQKQLAVLLKKWEQMNSTK
jgi:hypothetical protein